MKRTCTLGLAALALATVAQAQAPKLSGLVQVWSTQMLDNNLRLNDPAGKYYNLRSEFRENGFAIRRTELKLSGAVTEDLDYEVMFDPSISSGSTLQDAVIRWRMAEGFELKAGQFKTLQTLEGLARSSELRFVERSQLGRVIGDDRQRGAVLSAGFGEPKGFWGRLHAGVFNGASKANDANAQKDFVGRLEMGFETAHSFGLYTLQGRTDLADKGKLVAATFAGTALPTAAEILDGKDKTSNLGAYYQYQDDTWYAAAEVATGLLGRRFPSLGTAAGPAARQHLDQKYLGYALTGGYTFGHHSLLARFDVMDYNAGDDWYTAYNPYTQSAPGVSTGRDITPRFTETTFGYLYAWKPEKLKAANLKVNYTLRSRNFLAPRAGQSGEQGGDTLSVALQVAF